MIEIIVAGIGFLGTVFGGIAAIWAQNKKIGNEIKEALAVQNNEIMHLKEDVKEHNHYAKLFSETVPVIQEQMKVTNHRLTDLEKKVG